MAKNYTVYRNQNDGHLCLVVDQNSKSIIYIPLYTGDLPLQTETTSKQYLNSNYKALPKYPIKQMCQLLWNYAKLIGAEQEVLTYLTEFISLTKEEKLMATKKGTTSTSKNPAVKKTSKTTAKKAPAKKTSKTTAKKAPAKKTSKSQQSTPTEYKSASAMFQALIMQGKLTDDEIFTVVQDEFNLDDKKRSYVGWYRNKLRKDGKNPPPAKK